ncbi:hypothetical protein [Nonlabens tegetincola]|uniref:hypothetical protein n=1 Tax=Nonlabens tegetincola TaxID=323273 RepID=UPI000CF4BD08|nr:hypothetical protein [Nonlabens tegetincola]PQJ18443.1 hypothetical protein BST93_08125 [Nonlabens tegetincola]
MTQQELDTLALIDFKSSESKAGGSKQVILVTESKAEKAKAWYETSFLVSFVYPMLTAIAIILASRFFDRRKNKKALKKSDKEIEKLKVETENIKRSFQPIVISTLQATQDKLLAKKIEALEKLTYFFNQIVKYKPSFNEGELVIPTKNEIFLSIFLDFQPQYKIDYMNFHNSSSFLFSDIVLKQLDVLSDQISRLTEKKVGHIFKNEMISSLDNNTINLIDDIIRSFKNCQSLMRKDCFLDTEFIHQFIEENKR